MQKQFCKMLTDNVFELAKTGLSTENQARICAISIEDFHMWLKGDATPSLTAHSKALLRLALLHQLPARTYEDSLRDAELFTDQSFNSIFRKETNNYIQRQFAIGNKAVSFASIANLVGANKLLISRWVKEQLPNSNKQNKRIVSKLEELYQLKPGTLAKYLKTAKCELYSKTEKSEAQTNINLNHRGSHFLKSKGFNQVLGAQTVKPNATVRRQWQDLIDFKTNPLRTINGKSTNMTWKLVAVDENVNIAKNWFAYTRSATKVSPSADNTFRSISNLFSYACLSAKGYSWKEFDATPEELKRLTQTFKGDGRNLADAHLAWLADEQLIIKTIEWLNTRLETASASLALLKNIKSLIAERGYIRLNKEFATYNKLSMEQWEKHCKNLHTKIARWDISIREQNRTTAKKSKNKLQQYDSGRPFEVFHRLQAGLKAEMPKRGSVDYAIWARDTLLITLLSHNPLRINTISQIRIFGKKAGDGLGHVKSHLSGYSLEIPTHLFKNLKGSDDTHYRADLSDSVCEAFDNYMSHRYLLAGGETSPYLFLTKRSRTKKILDEDGVARKERSDDIAIDQNNLSIMVLNITKRVLGTEGFSAHHFRHLVATNILKFAPNDFMTVRQVLHDTLDVVLRNYNHMECSVGLDKYAKMLKEARY
jgi:integrase